MTAPSPAAAAITSSTAVSITAAASSSLRKALRESRHAVAESGDSRPTSG